jgi:hypothetical protein
MDLLDVLQQLNKPAADQHSEADTRAKVVDPVLEALGWSAATIRREPYTGWADDKGFIDYLLSIEGKPRYVVEAKRTGRVFEIPASLKRQRYTSYKKLRASASPDLKEALEQCLRYALHTGAPYAAATNGLEWVFFKPAHQYRALPDARVAIFAGTDDIQRRLNEFEDVFSKLGVEQGRCEKALLGKEIQAPSFAKRLRELYPYNRYTSLEEEDYSRILMEIVDPLLRNKMIDVADDEDFRECYVPVRGNFSTATSIGAAIIGQAKRLAAQHTAADFTDSVLRQSTLPNIVAGRTLVLHGAMGVGKTTFLRRCEWELREAGELQKAVWARVDLLPFRDRPFEISQIEAILSLISTQIYAVVVAATENMSGSYDPQSFSHLRAIYNAEARRFQKGRFPNSNDSDPVYLEEARRYIWDLSQKDPQEHLLRTVGWLTGNKLPVVLILDNSDQLGLEFQEYLYKLSGSLQRRTSAVTILVLRTEALASHRIREHAIASVDEYYQIIPAPLPAILKRRFERMQMALNGIEANDDTTEGKQRKVASERLATLMETLEYEASVGSEAFRIIDGVGNGSLRDALRATSALFRASPKMMDALVVEAYDKGRARLSSERVLRSLMKEDLRALDSHRLVPNVFVTEDQVLVPYSLGIRLMQQVKSRATVGENTLAQLLNSFAIAGVDRSLCERVLIRLRRDRLLVVPHILPDLRDDDPVSVSSLGEAVLDTFLRFKDYYSQMVFDTHIYDSEVFFSN